MVRPSKVQQKNQEIEWRARMALKFYCPTYTWPYTFVRTGATSLIERIPAHNTKKQKQTYMYGLIKSFLAQNRDK